MSKPVITVYSKPKCVQCTAVKRTLDGANIAYEDADGTAHAEFLFDLNKYMGAPVTVVRVGDEIVQHFYGNNPGELDKLKALVAA